MRTLNAPLGTWVTLAQGLVTLGAGLWGLVARRHYKEVHRIEYEHWILNAHIMWLLLVGGVLTFAGTRRRIRTEDRLLGLRTAGGLAVVDLVSAATMRIAPIYY